MVEPGQKDSLQYRLEAFRADYAKAVRLRKEIAGTAAQTPDPGRTKADDAATYARTACEHACAYIYLRECGPIVPGWVLWEWSEALGQDDHQIAGAAKTFRKQYEYRLPRTVAAALDIVRKHANPGAHANRPDARLESVEHLDVFWPSLGQFASWFEKEHAGGDSQESGLPVYVRNAKKGTLLTASISTGAILCVVAAFLFMRESPTEQERPGSALDTIEGEPSSPEQPGVVGGGASGFQPSGNSQADTAFSESAVRTPPAPLQSRFWVKNWGTGSFWIDMTEVSMTSYESCVKTGSCSPIDWSECKDRTMVDGKKKSVLLVGRPEWLTAEHPAVCVTGLQAETYCRWANGALPLSEQWLAAAGGPNKTRWPWGTEWKDGGGNGCLQECGLPWKEEVGNDDDAFAAPVGAYPRFAWDGPRDLVGNVWEITANRDGKHVAYGGAWNSTMKDLGSGGDYGLPPGRRWLTFGFRCAYPAN